MPLPIRARKVLFTLLAPVLLVGLLTTVGPLRMDPLTMWSGIGIGHRPGWLPGFPTIDPNEGTTSFALGVRAARDLLSGRLPLWNHFEGLGAPLLGEMQSAALFPPTWLLLLPYGQAIEHALLQALAGLGTYLFLRRFGLGATAALAGGLLFEFNGVFAWLRNAIYNPVAFLPWLFYAIESLFCRERDGGAGRWPTICLGAIMAALALYAGFPEVVYFYALLLALWTGLRAFALPARRAVVFAGDLLAVAALALLMASPLLLAFGQFLPEAAVGGHHGDEFRDHFLPPQAFLVALLPYVFGPIFGTPLASVGEVWSSIGGYLGIAPLLLPVAGLACSWRRAASWLLALWVVIAVGASHGVPVLHGLLTALPLATIAAYCRYLDAGWIFACVVLGAIFIDRVDAMGPAERRRAAAGAGGGVLVLVAVGVCFAWSVLAAVPRRPVILSFGLATLSLGSWFAAIRLRRPAPVLASLAIAEATAAFLFPFAANPRFVGTDRVLVGFLREHAGLQRIAVASGTGIGPNFGSVLGFPAINYDDLPVPARTARFVTTRLDATNDGVIFGHNVPGSPALLAGFQAALAGYAAAGVRYVLSADDFATEPAYRLAPGPLRPIPLSAGREAVIEVGAAASPFTIGAVTILIGTYQGAADGTLLVRVCQEAHCASGTAALATALDNRTLPIALDAPVTISPAAPYRISIAKQGGQHEVALWMRPSSGTGATLADFAAPPGYMPIVARVEAADPVPVLRIATSNVFELRDARPYASAPGCRVQARSHDRIEAHCVTPSRLLRLEVFMSGWFAQVNGADTPIVPVEDTFQGVDLPEGDSSIEFTYAPRGVRASLPVALAGLLLCVGVLAQSRR